MAPALLALLLAGPAPAPAAAAPPVPAAPAPASAPDTRARAETAYDQGRYEEARALLEALDREGKTDGPLLYRLAYCLRRAGDQAAERSTLERAVDLLERAWAGGGTLETAFYLANAYRNLGRQEDARAVAAAATAKVESRVWPAPTDAIDLFRVGKLYQDQEAVPQAATWFGQAADALAATPGRAPAYLSWARQFAGAAAQARGDFAEAERQFAALVAAGSPTPVDLDALASARARQGKWGPAADAWQQAEKLDPAQADRPRYCARLARQAEEIGTLPAQAPDGRAWGALTQKELEDVLAAQAARNKELRSAAPPAGDASGQLRQARALFVAAGLEYAVRRFPIRETAFQGGYAPLIFHPDYWEMPAAPAAPPSEPPAPGGG